MHSSYAHGVAAYRALLLAPPPSSYMPYSPLPWIWVALLGALLTITVAAAVYALSGLWGGADARGWSRKQILEALLSVVLLIIFIFIYFSFSKSAGIYSLFLNAATSKGFASFNLVPKATAISPGCASATNIFLLSTCDISNFQIMAYNMMEYDAIYTTAASLLLTPGIDIRIEITHLLAFSFKSPVASESIASTASLIMNALLFGIMVNQVQVLLVSAAPLILSLLLSLGLVSRPFGITRGFGGTMIALGLGLGFIYPLLVSITYGFIAVQIAAYYPVSLFAGLNSVAGVGACLGKVLSLLIKLVTPALYNALSSPATYLSNACASYISNTVIEIGYIAVGLTMIPLLNLVILGAFIRDMSAVMGDRITFSLFANIL